VAPARADVAVDDVGMICWLLVVKPPRFNAFKPENVLMEFLLGMFLFLPFSL
jgi:hypothetical protein